MQGKRFRRRQALREAERFVPERPAQLAPIQIELHLHQRKENEDYRGQAFESGSFLVGTARLALATSAVTVHHFLVRA